MKPLEKARLRLAYRIAESLEKEFELNCMTWQPGWDQDKAARLINILIPDSNAEAEEWQEELRKIMDGPDGPPLKQSCMDELREVLDCGAGMDIISVIKLATKEIKEFNRTVSAEADDHSNYGLM